MVDFGDELIIESYRIPWLIWIQLLVMILLIVLLLFGFSVFTLDVSTNSSAVAPPSSGCNTAPPTHLDNSTSSNRIITVEDHGHSSYAGTGGGSVREEDQSAEESCMKDSVFLSIFRRPNNPCNYIGLAKQALFKCFGLDSNYESSSSRQHEKRE